MFHLIISPSRRDSFPHACDSIPKCDSAFQWGYFVTVIKGSEKDRCGSTEEEECCTEEGGVTYM